MGKSSPSKRAARRLKMRIADCELRKVELKRAFKIVALFGVLLLFALNNFAQKNAALTQAEIDWIATKTFWEQQLKSGSDEQKRDALYQIRNYKSARASFVAVPALQDKAEIVRATATFSVVYLSPGEAINALSPLLHDKKSELVRREAAYALGRVGNSAAINFLIQTFQTDKSSDVKNACIVALGEIGDVAAVDALVRILQNKPKKENPADDFLRRSAARSVGQIAQIIQISKRETLTPESFLPEKYDLIETPQYPKIIEKFPVFQTAINVLIQTLQNPREAADTKREAAFALGAVGDESARNALQPNLTAADYYLAEISKESLRKIAYYALIYQREKDRRKNSE